MTTHYSEMKPERDEDHRLGYGTWKSPELLNTLPVFGTHSVLTWYQMIKVSRDLNWDLNIQLCRHCWFNRSISQNTYSICTSSFMKSELTTARPLYELYLLQLLPPLLWRSWRSWDYMYCDQRDSPDVPWGRDVLDMRVMGTFLEDGTYHFMWWWWGVMGAFGRRLYSSVSKVDRGDCMSVVLRETSISFDKTSTLPLNDLNLCITLSFDYPF